MREKLVFDDKTVTGEDLFEGVTQIEDVGSGGDLQYGTAAMGEVSFSTMTKLAEGEQFSLFFDQTEDGTGEFVQAGTYYVSSCKNNGGRYAVVAHDSMALFEVDVSAWVNGLTYPITLYALLSSLCGHIGVTLATASIPNGEREIPKNFSASGITGRQVLSWIAAAAACFALFRADGKLYLSGYSAAEIALDETNTTEYIAEGYTTDLIDRVQVRSAEADIGVVVGDGENAYIVESNPLLLAETDAELRPFAETIYTMVSNLAHVPYSCHMLSDNGVQVGDIITIDGAVSYVMRIERTPSGVTISATGDKRRAVQGSDTNAEIIALRGKTNELTRTVEENTLRIADAEGNLSQLSQTVSGFDARIENAEGEITTLSATVAGLSTRVTDAEGNISNLDLTASSLASRITNAEGDISTLEQTASNISARVGQNEVAISNLGIQLTGYVTFSNLSTAGQTTINGANITTGTITAITLSGCRFVSANSASGGTTMELDGGMLMFYDLYGNVIGGVYANGSGRLMAYGTNGNILTLGSGSQIAYGSSYYDIIHAGNISNYISNVYAVFG
ncbi:MAG: hypothetical protein IJX53_00740 [Clostridia bacterium]|nr:hypothetical protein [Clostridia bacterium]